MSRSKPTSLKLPPHAADEIAGVAQRTGSSVAFIVRRALATAASAGAPPARADGAPTAQADGAPTALAGELRRLELTTNEDDPPELLARIRAVATGPALDGAVAQAWELVRGRFLAWAEREASRRAAAETDELDLALRDASAPDTPAARLLELAESEYPRVRALVAAHPATPAEAVARLAGDREPVVRRAAAERTG